MSSWYEKRMPKIKDIKPHISKYVKDLKDSEGVKSIHIWGSYAKNIEKPQFRVRDIDVLVKTSFHSGDLISIDNNIITELCSDNYLENQGYDPLVVKFSKEFLKLKKYNIDCWAISSDRKLTHWGPIYINETESEENNKEAEKYANDFSGIERKKINKFSETVRNNWYNHYFTYMNKCFKNMPTGWYKTEYIKMKDIFAKAIKI